jgi:hypothetical protein
VKNHFILLKQINTEVCIRAAENNQFAFSFFYKERETKLASIGISRFSRYAKEGTSIYSVGLGKRNDFSFFKSLHIIHLL